MKPFMAAKELLLGLIDRAMGKRDKLKEKDPEKIDDRIAADEKKIDKLIDDAP